MRDLKKYYKIDASQEDLYNCLTNVKMIEIWTGEPAVMSLIPNSTFELWDGSITGITLDFEENRKIVQEWFFGEDQPSIVTIKLHDDKGRTSVELRQTNIPDEAYDNIVEGWDEDYFGALTALFEN